MKYKRLKFIMKLINENDRVLDVGTDHALLPIMLVNENITRSVVAADLNPEPLNAAINNIKENNLEEIINTKLMNGIEGIEENEFDTIVIAGMGGITISEIIKAKKFNGKFILHATTNLEQLRHTINEIGYLIEDEFVVFEGKVHNVIIVAKPGNEDLNERDIFMGPKLITKNDEPVINYYNHLFNVFERNSKLSKDDSLRKEERKWLKEKLWNE